MSVPGAVKKTVVLNAILAGAAVGATVDQKEFAGVSALIDSLVTTLKTSNVLGFVSDVPPVPIPGSAANVAANVVHAPTQTPAAFRPTASPVAPAKTVD